MSVPTVTVGDSQKQKDGVRKMLHIKQKIYGLVFVLISIVVPLISGDATISLITLPLGLWFLFTNEQIPELEGRCEE